MEETDAESQVQAEIKAVPEVEQAPKHTSEEYVNSLIIKADEATERLEAKRAEVADILKLQEAMNAETVLSGTANAGKQALTEEEIANNAAKAYLKGTGYEDILD